MSYSCCDFVDTILDALGIVVPEESWESPGDQADFALEVIERRELALKALLDWGREHTSPRDPNSPHALLVEAAAALAPYAPPDDEEEDDNEEAETDAAG